MAVAIYLIRHGESVGNVKRFFQGQQDIPLTETGHAQAQALAAWLAAQGFKFEQVFASPLSRARVTAETVCEALSLPTPELDHDIKEYSAGSLEGLTREEIDERYPQYAQLGLAQRGDFSAFGGESYDDMQTRLRRFIARMQDLPRDADFAAVMHGGCLYQLLKLWCGWPTPRNFLVRLTNCCVIKLHLREIDNITAAELQWFIPLDLMASLSVIPDYVEV